MNDIREDLKAYLDGELSDARAAEVKAAFAADSELAQEAEFMKMLGFEIRKAVSEPVVAGRAIAVEKIRYPKRFRLGNWSSWPFALQASVGVFFAAIVVSALLPVFAQPKEASIAGALNAERANRSRDYEAQAYAGSRAPSTVAPPAEDPSLQGRYNDSATEKKSDEGLAAGSATGEPKQKAQRSRAGEAEASMLPGPIDGVADKVAKTTVPIKGGNRMVIKNADVACRVASVSSAMAKTGSIAESFGGFVISSNSSDLKGENPTGNVVLRVPAIRFDSAMKQIRELGDVINESSSGEDVTAQVADMGARIKVLRAEEESYITMLRAAKKVGEMLEIKERLSGVRQEIESYTAQVISLKDLASMSTITASFEEKTKRIEPQEEPKDGFAETWASAVNGLQSALQFLGSMGIFLFVYSPIWLPVVGIFWWLGRRAKRA